MLVGYLAIAPLTRALQLPGKATLVLADALFLVPALLLPLYLLGRQRTGRWTLEGIVRYRRLVPLGSLGLAFLGIAMWVVFVTASLSWVDDWMLANAFAWLPQSIVTGSTLELSGYAAAALVGSRLLGIVIAGFLAPLAEELYFRGYLLPRISWMGSWAVLFQAVLFAGYHFLSPWAFVTRFLILVPTIYFVHRTRSIWFMVIGHTLLNVAGETLALLTVLNAVGW